MAQKVIVQLVDDFDGGEAEETISFALDGVSYEIDLASQNAEALRKAVAPYAERGRRVGRAKPTSRPRTQHRQHTAPAAAPAGPTGPVNREAIRTWAKENGYDVADRGRISREVMAAFDHANA